MAIRLYVVRYTPEVKACQGDHANLAKLYRKQQREHAKYARDMDRCIDSHPDDCVCVELPDIHLAEIEDSVNYPYFAS